MEDNIICNSEDLVIEPITTETPVPLEPETCPECEMTQDNYFTHPIYFGTLQNAVTTIWNYHLSTNKHYIHVELEALYHMLLGQADSLIEIYYGTQNMIPPTSTFINVLPSCEKDCIQYLNDLSKFIRDGREQLFSKDLTEIWSSIDDMLTIIDRTLYKLTSFKEEPIQTFEEFIYSSTHHLNESCGDCDCSDDEEEE